LGGVLGQLQDVRHRGEQGEGDNGEQGRDDTCVCVGGGEGGVGVDKEGSEAEIRVWQPRPNVSGLKACYWLVLGAQSCRQLR